MTGLPVVIVTSERLCGFFSDTMADEFVDKKGLLKNPRYISFATLSGNSKKMLVFEVEKMLIDNVEYKVVVGLGAKSCAFDCDLLLNAKMFF